jgi:hypothetical protein
MHLSPRHQNVVPEMSHAHIANSVNEWSCRPVERPGIKHELPKSAIPNLAADAPSAVNARYHFASAICYRNVLTTFLQVKCDQASPACGNCVRLGLECSYEREQRRSSRFNVRFQSSLAQPSGSAGASSQDVRTTIDVLGESKERRLLELRLLHHWMAVVSRPFMDRPAPRWGELWRLDLPLIAFNSDAVLHALLTMSATHLLPTISESSDDHTRVLAARDQYMVLALQEQRAAVEGLNAGNVDELSFAALLISLNAFSMLRERSLEPYEPPISWLEMGRGAGSVMRQAREFMTQDSQTKLSEIIRTTAPIHKSFEAQQVDESILRPYEALLNAVNESSENAEVQGVYRDTIICIATFRKAIQSGEPPYVHLRRICMFPFTVPSEFVELVREQKPAALVVLAHFFAVISRTEALQYLGNTGDDITASRREVVGISQVVPEQWQQMMIWPLDEVRAEV